MRPKTLTVVAVFLFFASAISALVAISLLAPNPLVDRLWELNKPGAKAFRAMGKPAAVFLLALAAATAMGGQGLLKGKRWAWWFALGLFVVNGCGDIVSFIVTGDWLRSGSGIMVAAVFIYLLLRARARSAI